MKPVQIKFTLKNFVTSVEVSDENNTFRSEFTAMNNHDRESIHRLIVFVSQNCHASRFQVTTDDKRSQTLAQKESESLAVVSADQESDSQGSETNVSLTKKVEIVSALIDKGALTIEQGVEALNHEPEKEGDSNGL